MKLVVIANMFILLGGLGIGLYALHLGHPVYSGFCVAFGFFGMMNYESKPEESKDEQSN